MTDKQLIQEYERRMGIGEKDPAKDGYLVLVKLLRQQNEYLDEFKLKNKIASSEKNDVAEYKNAKDLWDDLPSMIKAVTSLRMELKMEGEEKKERYVPVSPKSIADGVQDY